MSEQIPMTKPVLENSEQLAEQLGSVVDDYLDRRARGEHPTVEHYVRQHPELAKFIRQSLGALEMLDETTGAIASRPDHLDRCENRCLGDFQILGELGRGGMGIVYEAQQLSLHRRVALKVLPFAGAMDGRQLQRFKIEAQAAALLHHQNIVPVFGIGSDRGVHFYAMQFIEGETLAAVVSKLQRADNKESSPQETDSGSTLDEHGPPGSRGDTKRDIQAALSTEHSIFTTNYVKRITELGIQAADALDHAHSEGVVHRDVKPSNLILDDRGKIWVTDFGLALVEANPALTMTGDLVGTIRYMSPEQAQGKRMLVDHRTDVYSLCATIYELLTLRRAFDGADRNDLIQQIVLAEPVPARKLNPSIPRELETILTKGMEKNREDRYASAAELANDLRRLQDNRPILARPPSLLQKSAKFSRRHRSVVVSAVVLLAFVTIGLMISNLMISFERDEKQAALEVADQERERAKATVLLGLESLEHVFLDVLGEQVEQEYRSPDLLADELRKHQQLLESALVFYEEFAAQNHDIPIVRSETAKAYLRIGQINTNLSRYAKAKLAFQKSAVLLEGLREEFPNEPDFAYQLGLAHLSMAPGGLSKAVEVLRPLVQSHPTNPDYLYTLGIAYRGTKQTEEAIAILSDLHRRFPDEHKYQAALAVCYEGERRTNALIALAKSFPQERPYQNRLAMRFYILGHREKNSGNLPAALDWYQESLNQYQTMKNEGGVGLVHLETGKVLQKLNRNDEAEESLGKAVESFEQLVSHRHEPWSWRMLAEGYYRLGDSENAIHAYREAVDLQKAKATAFPTHRNRDMVKYISEKLAELFIRTRRFDDAFHAIVVADSVARTQSSNTVVLAHWANELAWMGATDDQAEMLGLDRALKLATWAVEFSPDTTSYLCTLGLVHSQREEWASAVARLDPLVNSGRGGSLERIILSICHWHLGNHETASRFYREAEHWTGKRSRETVVWAKLRQEMRRLLSSAEKSVNDGAAGDPK